MLKVIIARGVSGSGKSTFCKSLGEEVYPNPRMAIVSADDYFNEWGDYKKVFDPKLLPQAHKVCQKNFLEHLQAKTPLVVVDNTNIESWEIAFYYQAAELWGYSVEIVNIPCDPYEAWERNIHGVPLKVVLSMHKRLQQAELPPQWVQRWAFRKDTRWEVVG